PSSSPPRLSASARRPARRASAAPRTAAARRAGSTRAARSSVHEGGGPRSTANRSPTDAGARAPGQAPRAAEGCGGSAGREGVAAVRPCLRALNLALRFPAGDLGPVLLAALRRLIAARSIGVVMAGRPLLWGWSASTEADPVSKMAPGGYGRVGGSWAALGRGVGETGYLNNTQVRGLFWALFSFWRRI